MKLNPLKTFVIFIYIFVTPEGKTIDKVKLSGLLELLFATINVSFLFLI